MQIECHQQNSTQQSLWTYGVVWGLCWLCSMGVKGHAVFHFISFQVFHHGDLNCFLNYTVLATRTGWLGCKYIHCACEKKSALHLKTAWPLVLRSLNLTNDTPGYKNPKISMLQPWAAILQDKLLLDSSQRDNWKYITPLFSTGAVTSQRASVQLWECGFIN